MIGNLGEGLIGVFQKLAGLSQPERLEILLRWLAGLRAKKRGESRARIPEAPGQFFDGVRAAQVGPHVFHNPMNSRLPARPSPARVGALAVEQRTLDGVHGHQFPTGINRAHDGIGESQFLCDRAADSGGKPEMSQAGAQLRPAQLLQEFRPWQPVDPFVFPSAGKMQVCTA